MRRLRVGLVALAIVLVGCGGPTIPLEVGVKEYPSDVIIGRAKQAALRQVVPAPRRVPVVRSSVTAPPIPSITPRELCPKADPLGFPADVATNTISKPPVEGTYYYRNDGTFDLGGVKGSLPPVTTREIKNVETNPPAFTFDIVEQATSITTSYLVDPNPDGGGVYMTKQVQQVPGGTATFTPTPMIRLLPFPLENGAEWDSVGTDLSTGTTWVVHGIVGAYRDENHDDKPDDADGDGQPDAAVPKIRVDACGNWLDAWAVRITGPQGEGTPAKILAPTTGTNVDFTATYMFGTQYGGFSLQDAITYDGMAGGSEFHVKYTSVIASVPAKPR